MLWSFSPDQPSHAGLLCAELPKSQATVLGIDRRTHF